MRQFDPWPVFFRREWRFPVGFAVTDAIITKMSLDFTKEDAKKSKFA
ncbi:ATP synthase small subunit 6, mitochondrial-like [Lycium barbarum]|nr:ATP synthase small subunit 6, mitochondrial-like [Lycium barbarum]